MSNSNFIELLGGLTVPVSALNLALTLEARGFRLARNQDRLTVGRADDQDVAGMLTTDDRAEIQNWKLHLLAVVDYKADHKATSATEKRNR